ncbi:MAG: T9SS type A sorting domain-containing protein [Bacteroidota bacterium]
MKKNYLSFLLVSLLGLGASAQTCDSLLSSCIGTFSRKGYFFDIEAVNQVTIRHFHTMSQNCGTIDVSVYYRTGTYSGNETNSSAWTLAGSITGWTPACAVSCPIPPTQVPVPINVCIPQGQRYGFYVIITTNSTTATLESHSNLPEGSIGAQDANIILYTGKGQAVTGAFAGNLTIDLTWQGIIDYDCTCLTGTDDLAAMLSARLFPVPATDKLNCEVSATADADAGIEIVNSIGELVYTGRQKIKAGDNSFTIDIHNLPAGIYYFRILSGGGTVMYSSELVKE